MPTVFPTVDAPVVTKLREAGAVILGKLNMHEFAYGGTCVISHYGPIRNPWNTDHVPGGSSGGSAAAVAARLCAAAPRHRHGRVDPLSRRLLWRRGLQGDARSREHTRHRAAVGDARSRRADRAFRRGRGDRHGDDQGFDPLDPVSIRGTDEPLRIALSDTKRPKPRIGIVRRPFFDGLDPDIAAATDAAIEVLRRFGSSVREVELPPVASFAVLGAETYALSRRDGRGSGEAHALSPRDAAADRARQERHGRRTTSRNVAA